MSVLTALAAAPAVYLLFLIYKLDKKDKEPFGLLVKLVAFGAITTIPACIIEMIGEGILFLFFEEESVLATVLYYTIVVAGTEELVKFLALFWSTWKIPSFNYRFDGVVYAVFVSLGFALLENILYVLQYGVITGILRALTAVPLHCAAGIYMGAFYGNAKKYDNSGDVKKSRANLIKAYFIPVLLHGIYDTLCSLDYVIAVVFFFLFVIAMYIVTIIYVRRYAANDEFIGNNKSSNISVAPVANASNSCINMYYCINLAKRELAKTNIYLEMAHGNLINSMMDLNYVGNNVPKIQIVGANVRLFMMENGVLKQNYFTNSAEDVVFYMLDYTIGVIATGIAANANNQALLYQIKSDSFARIGGCYDYWHRCGRSIFNMNIQKFTTTYNKV